jgi:hypothetical protein
VAPHPVNLVKTAEKRTVTEEEHEDFHLVAGAWLDDGPGEDTGRPFSQIIKEKYPESSKKRTGGGK